MLGPRARAVTAAASLLLTLAAEPAAGGEEDPAPYQAVVRSDRPLAKDPTRQAGLIDGETLRDSPRASTFEAIAREDAGVFVPSGGPGLHGVGNGATGGIRIRGLGGSPNTQVLVVEDGVPDFQGIFGHPLADAYAPSLLDEVLVVKGADSVLHGTHALGGTVLLRSRWRDAEGFEAHADSAAGSFATLRTSASALAREGRVDATASFFGLDTSGHREGAGGAEAVGTAAVRLRLGRGLSLTLREKVAHEAGADPGPVTHPTPDHAYEVWRDTASLALAYEGGSHRVTVTPYVNAGVNRLYDGFLSHDEVFGLIAEDELRLGRSLRLLAGAAWSGVAGSVENRVTGERPEVRGSSDAAPYAQLTWRPFPPFTLVAGAREVVSSRYGAVALLELRGRWDVLPGLNLRGGMSDGFRQPTLRELYLPYPVANPELRPERARSWDLALEWTGPLLSLDAAGYRTAARDLIRTFGVFPAAEAVNVDRVTVWGGEARAAIRGLGPFSARAGLDVQDVGRYTRQNPSARATFTLAAAHGFRTADLASAELSGEWVHGLYMADYGRERLPDVTVMDVAVRYRRASSERVIAIEPYLDVRNLLGARYAYVAGYVMPGVNVLAGLRLSL